MASTFTPNRRYDKQGTGDNVDAWGPPLNANFDIIDKNLSTTLGLSMAGGSISLTLQQAQNLVFNLGGTMSSDAAFGYPQLGGFFIVSNATGGGFTTTVRTSAGGSVGVPTTGGTTYLLYSDGLNVYRADTMSSVPIGTVVDTASGGPPSGWLLCDGSAISRTTFSALFAAISTNYGPGNGSTTFNIPDCRGRLRAGVDTMGGGAAGRITVAGSGIAGNSLNGTGGSQNVALLQAQLPIFTPSGTVFVTYPPQGYLLSNGGSSYAPGSTASAFNSYTNASTTPPGGVLHSLSISSIGSGQAHNNMPPTIIFNTMIKAF